MNSFANLFLSNTVTPIDCQGNSTGAIDLTVSGGTAPYSYDWDNDGAEDPDNDSQDLSSLAAGTYSVTVTDMTGCSDSLTVILSDPPEIQITLNPTNLTCKSNGDGNIDLIIVGGGNLSYEYYEGRWNALPDFSTLSPVSTGSVTSFSITSAQSNNEFAFRFFGTITIDSTGDYTFYTQSDDGSQLFIDGVLVVDNDGLHGSVEEDGTVTLSEGIHTIEVTFFEKFGQQSLLVSYEGPTISKMEIPPSALSGPYIFAWDNGAMTEDLDSLVAGNYVVTVTNSGGCSNTASVIVSEPDTLSISEIIVHESCPNLNNGMINLTVSGGITPYSFDWNDNSFDGMEDPTDLRQMIII